MVQSATVDRAPGKAHLSRAFFMAFALVVAALVLAGFTRTFFLPLARGTFTAPWFVYVHGSLFCTWVGLLTAQSALVARRRTATHRRLGRVALALIPLMIASGVAVAIWSSVRDFDRGGGDAAVSLFGGELIDMLVFGTLAAAALLMRLHSASHKRLIALATLVLLGAAVGRIPVIGLAANYLVAALLLCLAGYDLRTRSTIHVTTAVGGVLLLIDMFASPFLGATPRWQAVGRQLLGVATRYHSAG